MAVHRRAGLDERGGTIRSVAAYMIAHAGEQIEWRDFQMKCRSIYPQMTDAQVDIQTLIEMRWLRLVDGELEAIGVKGKSNPTIEIDARTRAFRGREVVE
jgi:hypothetical protein